jgi:hypothetical protein
MTTTRHTQQHARRFQSAAISFGLCSVVMLSSCATHGTGTGMAGDRYRCEQDIAFSVRFVDDSAIIDSTSGGDVLFRDAGGTTPQQTVFSNTRVKAEFGLGESGREAVLRYPLLPLTVQCVKR